MRIEGESGLVVSTDVLPFQRKKIATLVRANPRAGCNWKYSYSLSYVRVPRAPAPAVWWRKPVIGLLTPLARGRVASACRGKAVVAPFATHDPLPVPRACVPLRLWGCAGGNQR